MFDIPFALVMYMVAAHALFLYFFFLSLPCADHTLNLQNEEEEEEKRGKDIFRPIAIHALW